MKLEDVLAKHLNSIGTKEDRAKIKNQAIFSDVKVALKGNTSDMRGKAIFLSSSEKSFDIAPN